MPRAFKTNLTVLVAALWLMTPGALWAQTVSILQDSGDPALRVDIAVLGDGYTNAEMGKFASDVSAFMNSFLDEQPIREYRSYFNLRRIDLASAESGADHPERSPQVFRNTAFDATYNCSSIQRLICVSTTKVLNAASVLPPSQRDLIIVIVNDPEYGGSGGPVAVASTNVSAVELILHETGHTFAFLADEYTTQPPACVDTTEPGFANATKNTNRAAIKWSPWIDAATAVPTTGTTLAVPGLYLGSAYCPNTLYRPTYDSKMRSLGRSYDQINTEEFVKRFYDFAPPIETRSPATPTLTLAQGQTQQFTVTTPQPATHALSVTWQLDGQLAATGPAFTLSATLAPGPHTVTASVADTTPFVRNDPDAALRDAATWNIVVTDKAITTYALPPKGGYSGSTSGTGPLTVGHTSMQPVAGSSQAGLAIFSLRQNNVLIAEAAVPASPTITAGRIYAEVGSPVNTGIAISNPHASSVNVTFYYTDVNGANSPGATIPIAAYSQVARFLDENPFNAGASFRGTLTFTASAPVGAIALRGFYNERSEFLITTLPVLDLSAAGALTPPISSIVFPHFAAGGGWTTRILLVNPGDQTLTGTLTFRDRSSGTPVTLTVEGQSGSTFNYSIAARSSSALATSAAGGLLSGYVELVPTQGAPSPVGLVVFSFTPAGITTSEAGVPTVAAGNTFLLYAEASGVFGQPNSMQTGLAIANTSPASVVATLELRNLQGQMIGQGFVTIPGHGQVAQFLNQVSGLEGVPVPFQGLLRVSAPGTGITLVGLRARYNERGEFMITTMAPFPENQLAASELVFPHFVDGDGYTTRFVILNGQSQQGTGGTLQFSSTSGQPISPVLQ